MQSDARRHLAFRRLTRANASKGGFRQLLLGVKIEDGDVRANYRLKAVHRVFHCPIELLAFIGRVPTLRQFASSSYVFVTVSKEILELLSERFCIVCEEMRQSAKKRDRRVVADRSSAHSNR